MQLELSFKIVLHLIQVQGSELPCSDLNRLFCLLVRFTGIVCHTITVYPSAKFEYWKEFNLDEQAFLFHYGNAISVKTVLPFSLCHEFLIESTKAITQIALLLNFSSIHVFLGKVVPELVASASKVEVHSIEVEGILFATFLLSSVPFPLIAYESLSSSYVSLCRTDLCDNLSSRFGLLKSVCSLYQNFSNMAWAHGLICELVLPCLEFLATDRVKIKKQIVDAYYLISYFGIKSFSRLSV